MKKNAFTLIELIATIGLIGMLSTILITVSTKKINQTKEKVRDTMISSIELAAKNYINDYGNELIEFSNYDNIYISLQTLVEKEYFTESLIDPTTKKSIPLTNQVYVTREVNGKITATYNANQNKEPKLILNNSYNYYIKKGEDYVDLGVTAISQAGEDLSSSVITKGEVDTLIPNTYKITYQLYNTKITRNVIVYSDNMSSEEIYLASEYIEKLYKTGNYINEELQNPKITNNNIQYDAGIRYVGSTPNNYVYFNCNEKDTNNVVYGSEGYNYSEACELWRIIGVFDVDNGNGNTEKRVKLININSTFQTLWDSSASNINGGYGVNQWGPSDYSVATTAPQYPGSDLYQLLNGYYIGKSEAICGYNLTSGISGFGQTCTTDSLTNANMRPLTSFAKKMISDAIWYSYAIDSSTSTTAYLQERGIIKKYTGCMDTETVSCEKDGITRNNEWQSLVGLMNASDAIYANGWLYSTTGIWTMTPYADSYDANILIRSGSSDVSSYTTSFTFNVCPSLYLKSSIKITSGTGSTSSPYTLAI